MNILKELLLLFALSLLADLAVQITGLPIPGPVAGMLLLLGLLGTGILQPRHLEKVGGFLLANLAFLFLPLVVATRTNLPLLREYGGRLILLIALTTLTVMAVTGLTAQLLLRLTRRREPKKTPGGTP